MKILKYPQSHSFYPDEHWGDVLIMVDDDKKGDIGNINSLKERLNTITNEIDQIKNSFTKNTEELARIQSMLDVSSIEDVSGVIEKYENMVKEQERKRAEAVEGAQKYSQELEKEKERLVKLWDAYKNQEEELSNMEKKLTEYEEKYRTAEAAKKQIEEDYTARVNTLEQKIQENETKVNQFDEYKQKCENFELTCSQLENEVNTWKEDCVRKENTIKELNEQINKLREMENYSEYKTKYEEINAEYEKEKERLTKLYHLYEETDAECKKLREENKTWQNWYDSNKEIFDKLFSSAPPVKTTQSWETTTETPVKKEPESPIEDPTKKKPKKKKLFKK